MVRDLDQLEQRCQQFIAERDWERFHTPQNLAMAISVEANELMENLLWFNNPPSEEIASDESLMSDIEEEVADVFIYVLSLAHQLDIDLEEAVQHKIQQNEQRFDEERVEEITAELEKWQ